MRFILSRSGYTAIFWFFTTANAAVGDIVCRYTATTPSAVNYYMWQDLSDYYGISLEKLFELNPSLDPLCNNIKPKTEYCVAGFFDYLVSIYGFCGPEHNNASCIGTEKPCCNAGTWKCGNSPYVDCAPDTCYEGLCVASTNYYSLDGKCGPSTGEKECTGKWGNCCNHDGLCGTGPDFCSVKNCHNGACEPPPRQEEVVTWTFGTTPDGSCGGANGYTCGVIHGNCCSEDNKCGGSVVECGTGCQPKYGECDPHRGTPSDPPKATPPSQTDLPKLVWDPKTYTYVAPPVSKDGSCGESKGSTCLGSGFGYCCSQYSQCGDTASHCGQGCQSNYSSRCLITDIPSMDGSCGRAKAGVTCAGGPFDGKCCSAEGWCGDTNAYCNTRCQKGFGMCK